MSEPKSLVNTDQIIADTKKAMVVSPKPNGIKSKTGEWTPKSKAALGIPENYIITWVPFALSIHDNNILKALAKKDDIDVFRYPIPVLRTWWDANVEKFTEEVNDIIQASYKSDEDLEKEIARVQALSQRLTDALAKRKA